MKFAMRAERSSSATELMLGDWSEIVHVESVKKRQTPLHGSIERAARFETITLRISSALARH